MYSTSFDRTATAGMYRVPIVEAPIAVAQPAVATRHKVLALFFSSRNLVAGLQLNFLYCSLEQLKTECTLRVFQILQICPNDAPRSDQVAAECNTRTGTHLHTAYHSFISCSSRCCGHALAGIYFMGRYI
jgi:hypothetical protein